MKTLLTGATVFLLGMTVGVVIALAEVKAARERANQALMLFTETQRLEDFYHDQARELDASLQRCVELQAHRAKAN